MVYWLTVAVWLLISIEEGQGQGITLDGLPLSNYTLEEVKFTTPRLLESWYKMSDGFLALVHSKNDETIDLIIEYVKGKKLEWPGSFSEFLKLQYAMFACVVIGLVFAGIMALAGIIFFGCRMCGGCGGKRAQVITSRTSTWRNVHIFSLLVLAAVLLPAVIISFIINNSLKASLCETEKTVFSSLHDAEAFINNTELQVTSLVEQGIEKVLDHVAMEVQDVEKSIEKKLGERIQNMDPVLKKIESILSRWYSIPTEMEKKALNASDDIESLTSASRDRLSNLTKELEAALVECNHPNCSKINTSVFTMNENACFNLSEIINAVENLNSSLQKLNKGDYDEIITNIQTAVYLLPPKIAKKTEPVRNVILADIKTYKDEIENSKLLKKFEKTINVTRNVLQKLHHNVEKKFPDSHRYDKYRWYFGLALSIIMAVAIGGILIGLVCGICGHQNKKQATKRTTLSNAGGLTLMFTVYWMFLFSVLLMLITTSIFAVGGMIEAYVCRPAFDHNFTVFDKVLDTFQQMRGASDEFSLIKDLKASDALRDCANDGTIYSAFSLESLNISSLFQYRERLKIEQREKELLENSHPGEVFYKNNYHKLFSDLVVALDINTSFIDKLREKVMVGYESQVQLISEITSQDFTELANMTIGVIEDVEKLQGKRDDLANQLKEVVDLKNNIHKQEEMLKRVDNVMPGFIQQEIKEFMKQLMKYSDHMIALIEENFRTKLGPCRPLWNIFDASRTILCKRYVQPLNGTWFATGWALFFFIPIIIISTLLSKYFLRMKSVYTDERNGFEIEEKNGYELDGMNGYKVKPVRANYHL